MARGHSPLATQHTELMICISYSDPLAKLGNLKAFVLHNLEKLSAYQHAVSQFIKLLLFFGLFPAQ